MSVHLQMKAHVNKFIAGEKRYRELDLLREEKIEAVIQAAKKNQEFSLTEINAITEEMNNLSRKFRFPMRKLVKKEMVVEFINRKN
ncbi:DUF2533 family protein [Anaerobacillus sp. CMMVII]|uniref:YpbS family protein n=1 Tax=Anaerobacillus sp. CMMVII TaxID=2755588 RepID=UPI0021B82C05|nr:YpbS family protein [Anaerobacillus sp. CMMVII]MCT8139653.1 DUF2533 family protein [Anaerobacillus sp. CMMVII]